MKKIVFFSIVLLSHFQMFSQQDAWVYLTDKLNVETSISNPISILTQKAIDRKHLHNITIDERDVPVNESYIAQLKNVTGITVMAKSKWFNAIHVKGSQTDIKALESLSFINSIDFADKSLNLKKANSKTKSTFKLEEINTTFIYGNALNQIEMFKGDALHILDYTGTNVTIAVIDAGFPNVNTINAFQRIRDAGNILGEYDFVNRDNDVYTNTTSNHGTLVLSTMAGYVENEFVGTAPDASYYLFITEDATSETPVEESYWVEAAERADSLGVDVINTSLGYSDFDGNNYDYSQSDMNGTTTFISRGANIAFQKGMLLVTSAGNSGNWGITAPADSPNTLTVGAVDASGNYASFSSVGTTYQTTQKPDVVAQGELSYVITENNTIAQANGTSFSAPILAGGIACLWQAIPDKTNNELMQLVKESASQYNNSDFFLGYGIPNLRSSLNTALSTESNIKDDLNISLYPNPVENKLFIEFPSHAINSNLYLYDILGKYINLYSISNKNNMIDLSSLSNGLYIARVETNRSSKVFKIVKQ